MNADPVLEVTHLRVEQARGLPIVEDIAFSLEPGESLGIVGESGSGKTTIALALLGYTRPGLRFDAHSRIEIAGEWIVTDGQVDLRHRRKLISYVPQEPFASLNPAMRVGAQIREIIRVHFPERQEKTELVKVLARVHLPTDRDFQRRFPHQLSGGQQQRIALARALVGDPPVVVLDEPTTGLDVVTQARILKEIDSLRRERNVAIVYVSHDLAVVSAIAEHVIVMYAGMVVEQGATDQVLRNSKHPYTLGLLESIPDHMAPRRLPGIEGIAPSVEERPPGCAFAPRCAQRVPRSERERPELEYVEPGHLVRCFEWRKTPSLKLEPPLEPAVLASEVGAVLRIEGLRAEYTSRSGGVVAAQDISFSVASGRCVALVGESGSGKTTIARCIAGLHPPTSGHIALDGIQLPARAKQRSREARRRIQIVFQNPYKSLNPRQTVRTAVARPAELLRGLGRRDAEREVNRLLKAVRLPARLASRYPRELSGGERQRVAIARALAANPDVLVCDEITSALDVSVQAAVLELLASLRAEFELALLFISHNLGVVATVADWVLVLHEGVIVEQGPPDRLVKDPAHQYTRNLLESAPRLETSMVNAGT